MKQIRTFSVWFWAWGELGIPLDSSWGILEVPGRLARGKGEAVDVQVIWRALMSLPGPLWAWPFWASLGPYGPGPYWACRALFGPAWALMGPAVMGRALMAPLDIFFDVSPWPLGPKQLMSHPHICIYIHVHIYIYIYICIHINTHIGRNLVRSASDFSGEPETSRATHKTD